MIDAILQNTYEQLRHHDIKTPQLGDFGTFCRLIYKSLYGFSPGNSAAEALGIEEKNIQSAQATKMVGELYLLKEAMLRQHYKKSPNLEGLNNPIIIVHVFDRDLLIDGSNRINYFFAASQLNLPLNVNYHIIDKKHD